MKKSSNKPQYIAEVTWLDANTTAVGEHYSIKKAKEQKAVERISVGYLLVVNKDKVVIAATYDPASCEDETDTLCEITTIPAAWICKIKRLAVK